MELLFVAWLALALLGAYVAAQRGRGGAEGFFLGLLFGPLGVLVAALLPAPEKKPPVRPRWTSDGRKSYAIDDGMPGEIPEGWSPGDPVPGRGR